METGQRKRGAWNWAMFSNRFSHMLLVGDERGGPRSTFRMKAAKEF